MNFLLIKKNSENSMKTKLLILLICLFTLLACASKIKVFESEKSKVEKQEIVAKDSVYLNITSLPIDDTIFIGLQTNNRLIDSILDLKLSGFYSFKTSGKNKYSAKYDSVKKGIEISSSVQGSSDTEVTTNTNTTKNTNTNNSSVKDSNTVKGGGFNWWWFVFCLVLVIVGAFLIRFKFF